MYGGLSWLPFIRETRWWGITIKVKTFDRNVGIDCFKNDKAEEVCECKK